MSAATKYFATTDDTSSAQPARQRFQSVYDSSSCWRDWFSPEEYENPWDRQGTRFAYDLDFNAMDCASRHLIQLLQSFHRYEVVTTEKCNVVLKELLDSSRGEPAIAERAKAILENMELLDTNFPQEQSTAAVQKIARAIPRPNRITYNTTLQIYAKTRGSIKVPEEALAIVSRMEEKYSQRQILEMKPNAFHWNCALLAYKECDHWQRSVYALNLLVSNHAEMDISSYTHIVQLCAYHKNDRANPDAAELGARVAIRLFQEIFEKKSLSVAASDLPSHFYAFFLQAIRSLAVGSELRNQYFDSGISMSRQQGKINQFILKEFLVHAKASKLIERHLGPYLGHVRGLTVDDAVARLLTILPDDWLQNAD